MMTTPLITSTIVNLVGLLVCVYLLTRLRRVKAERDDCLDVMDDIEAEYDQKTQQLTKNFNASHAHFMSQALATQTVKALKEQLSKHLTHAYNKVGQQFLGNVVDTAETLTSDLNFALTDKIWDAFQQLKEKHRETPMLYPKYSKLAYTKGCRTIIIIEQEPQLRTVTFAKDIVTGNDRAAAASTSENGWRFNLAFPYVYFFMVFEDGKYFHHEVYFRNRAITSIREHVYLAPLPNIQRGNDRVQYMCMGDDFQDGLAMENTIARQCELVISDFWQLTFNGHLGNGGHEEIDKLKSYANWQAESKKDPLFILGVPWANGKTVKGITERLLENRERDHKLDAIDTDVKSILDENVQLITNKVKAEYQKGTVAALNEEWVDAVTRETLESILTEHTQSVFQHCTKG